MAEIVVAQRCIFCLEMRPGSEEHVFPLAIGGSLVTDRVCQECNSTLGSRIDSALTDDLAIRNRRAQLGLAGNSGTVPAMHDILLGIGRMAKNPERKVHTTFNEKTGQLETKAIPYVSDVAVDQPDGAKTVQVIVDERDRDQIPKIIQRVRKRHGAPPLSNEEFAAELEKYTEAALITEVRPEIIRTISYSFAYLQHSLVKIAYELACLWLGDAYLDDPTASQLRAVIFSDDPAATEGIMGYVGPAEGCGFFSQWVPKGNHHMAYSTVSSDGIGIAVRVFDIYAAVVLVSKDTKRYACLKGEQALRFLVINSVTRQIHDVPMEQELFRIAGEMRKTQRRPPFPDPLG